MSSKSAAVQALTEKNEKKLLAYKFVKMETDPTFVTKTDKIENLHNCLCKYDLNV
jgi:hypothetical protein